jgi:MFS superfamily sulfate permease-like transporter
MIFIALGVLVLAILVGLGRRPLMARAPGRIAGLTLAIVAAAIAAYDAARGGWLGGSILLTAALWLATSSWPPRHQIESGMSRAEAASMLGVGEDAGRAEIEAAYRRLMFRVHPDQGGAAGLAAQLNAARAVLLKVGR